TFAVADFSAIEARVIAWLADEKWRLDVFASHGKIYEASASAMFNVPIEEVTKGSSLRSKGKIAELALGYGGALGALKQMDKGQSGLDDNEMNALVRKWRKANPAIVKLWKDVEGHAKKAIKERGKIETPIKNLIFESDGAVLTIQLPSGRKLFYQSPGFAENRFGALGIRYKGVDQKTKQWGWVDTYGGKLVENIVQAISRDILAHSMLELDYFGHDINMHVHDEVVCEVVGSRSDEHLKNMIRIMDSPISWAPGLILKSDGYITPFYKKD
ncbi:MAG: hypothetical protein KAJ19_07850, partial [Gammaproteobacteria bacterium]|nr:hypothetical protein [Gammaproteobacteria bacterium]